jgi:hypothetical protein
MCGVQTQECVGIAARAECSSMDARFYALALLNSALRLIGESRGVLDAHCGDFTSALGGDAKIITVSDLR